MNNYLFIVLVIILYGSAALLALSGLKKKKGKKSNLCTMNKKDKAPQVKDYLCGSRVIKSKPQKITEVIPVENGGYQILTYDSHAFLQSHSNTIPQRGDIIVFYTIREKKVVGIELNGKLLYFLSEEDI